MLHLQNRRELHSSRMFRKRDQLLQRQEAQQRSFHFRSLQLGRGNNVHHRPQRQATSRLSPLLLRASPRSRRNDPPQLLRQVGPTGNSRERNRQTRRKPQTRHAVPPPRRLGRRHH